MSMVFGTDTPARMYIPKGASKWRVGDFLEKDKYNNVVLMSFGFTEQETVEIKRCFNETTHVFAFGRDIAGSAFTVSVALFLSTQCKNKGNRLNWLSLKQLKEDYNKNRVYKRLNTVDIVVDTFAMSGYLIGMSIGNTDPATKSCLVTFTFLPDQEV